jgi:hypothetical protein
MSRQRHPNIFAHAPKFGTSHVVEICVLSGGLQMLLSLDAMIEFL